MQHPTSNGTIQWRLLDLAALIQLRNIGRCAAQMEKPGIHTGLFNLAIDSQFTNCLIRLLTIRHRHYFGA